MKYLKSYKIFESENSTYMKACHHIINKLTDELDDNLFYHNVDHTKNVIDSVKLLCDMENVDDETTKLLITAAAYHDSGFLLQYDHNEPKGVEIAKSELNNMGFTDEQIDKISSYILATIPTRMPKTLPDKIMRDADLSYLGTDDYNRQSDALRSEWSKKGKVFNDEEWKALQIKFLNSHEFYTNSAKQLWNNKKQEHLNALLNVSESGEYKIPIEDTYRKLSETIEELKNICIDLEDEGLYYYIYPDSIEKLKTISMIHYNIQGIQGDDDFWLSIAKKKNDNNSPHNKDNAFRVSLVQDVVYRIETFMKSEGWLCDIYFESMDYPGEDPNSEDPLVDYIRIVFSSDRSIVIESLLK